MNLKARAGDTEPAYRYFRTHMTRTTGERRDAMTCARRAETNGAGRFSLVLPEMGISGVSRVAGQRANSPRQRSDATDYDGGLVELHACVQSRQ